MRVEVTSVPFDPWAVVGDHQAAQLTGGSYGATAVFIGTMRDFNAGDTVRAMTLEHYPGMTERYLERISRSAAERWDILDSLIVHRVGVLRPDDPIVLTAVWSAHRAAAFDACRYLMEELKSRAPFWKKEALDGGGRWVQANTPG
ncbi:MAG TPA: molybdenum cofactor biosynthesis protein MoaE [Gammaproteobacteria bacterium]|nr:molybdenum cofactor biosynthesis protein MoaE [Gammaproteobacteria bacterium]